MANITLKIADLFGTNLEVYKTTQNNLSCFPDEILLLIIKKMNKTTLQNFSLTSYHFFQMIFYSKIPKALNIFQKVIYPLIYGNKNNYNQPLICDQLNLKMSSENVTTIMRSFFAIKSGKFPLLENISLPLIYWNVFYIIACGYNNETLIKNLNCQKGIREKTKREGFIQAAKFGHANILNNLIEKNIKPIDEDDICQSSLYLANKRGHLSIVEILHKQDGYAFNYWPFIKGHFNLVRYYLNHDETTQQELKQAFIYTIKWNHLDLAMLTLEKIQSLSYNEALKLITIASTKGEELFKFLLSSEKFNCLRNSSQTIITLMDKGNLNALMMFIRFCEQEKQLPEDNDHKIYKSAILTILLKSLHKNDSMPEQICSFDYLKTFIASNSINENDRTFVLLQLAYQGYDVSALLDFISFYFSDDTEKEKLRIKLLFVFCKTGDKNNLQKLINWEKFHYHDFTRFLYKCCKIVLSNKTFDTFLKKSLLEILIKNHPQEHRILQCNMQSKSMRLIRILLACETCVDINEKDFLEVSASTKNFQFLKKIENDNCITFPMIRDCFLEGQYALTAKLLSLLVDK